MSFTSWLDRAGYTFGKWYAAIGLNPEGGARQLEEAWMRGDKPESYIGRFQL